MTDLAATSEGEVQGIIQTAKPKSSSLDPLPTSLLMSTLAPHIPTMTHMINVSFESATVLLELKEAVITLLLKNPALDTNTLKNYHPVSSLPFMSKILEKVAAKRLIQHLTDDGYNWPTNPSIVLRLL